MKQYENDVERYLQELEQLLPGDQKEKARFLERMEENIFQYEEEANVEVDYARLVTYFGSPATIAKDYASAWEGELTETESVATSRIPWRTIMPWICVALLLLCAVLLLYTFGRGFLNRAVTYMVAASG